MHNSISKKLLAGALSVMMVLSLVAPTNAQAASSYSLKQKSGLSKLTADKAYTYYVKGVKKTQYVKVAKSYKDVVVKKGSTTVKKATKIKGTGKTITLKLTAPDKVKNYKNTLKVKVYNKKTNKLVKTLKKTATIKVKALNITSVEPTTAGATHKYVKVTFNKAISSLDSSEVEIRNINTQQLHTVEKVALAKNGKSAVITLLGDASVAGTTFLASGSKYEITIKQDGVSTSLEFELPTYHNYVTVTGVDTKKNTLSVGTSKFVVPTSYKGNLGELVGRSVAFFTNADNEILDGTMTLADETVIYASIKDYAGTTASDENYIKDVLTGETYTLSTAAKTTATTKNRNTVVYNVVAGTATTIATNDVVNYAKIVLNPDKTVRYLGINTKTAGFVTTAKVASVKGTVVTATTGNAYDLKNATIVKDGKYVEASTLVAGDMIYFDTLTGLVDVNNGEVKGKISKVYSDSIVVNGKEYDFTATGLKYLNAKGEEKGFTTLGKAEKYLLSLDTTVDTTLNVDRCGEVRYVSGTIKDAKVTTTKDVILTEKAQAYQSGLGTAASQYISLNYSDGTQTKKDVNVKDLVEVGDAKTITSATLAIAGSATDQSSSTLTIVGKQSDGTTASTTCSVATQVGTLLPKDALVTVVLDKDSNLVGFVPQTATSALAAGKSFESGLKTIVAADGNTYALSDSVKVYVLTDKSKTDSSRVVTVCDYKDFSRKTSKATGMPANVKIYTDKANVTSVVIDNQGPTGTGVFDDSSEDKNKVYTTGIVSEVKTGTDSEGTANKLVDFTVKTSAGDVEYKNVKAGLTAPSVNDIVTVTTDTSKDGQVVEVVRSAKETTTTGFTPAAANGNVLHAVNGKEIVATSGALVLKYNSTKKEYEVTNIATMNNSATCAVVYNAFATDGINVQADVILFTDDAYNAVKAELDALTVTSPTYTENAGGAAAPSTSDATVGTTSAGYTVTLTAVTMNTDANSDGKVDTGDKVDITCHVTKDGDTTGAYRVITTTVTAS